MRAPSGPSRASACTSSSSRPATTSARSWRSRWPTPEAYADDRTGKPPTVYRALEFLEQAGLVHRIASLNAFVACDSAGAAHAAAFLICDCCGSAQEFDPGEVRPASSAAKAEGFTPRAITLEVRGRCAACR